MTILRPITSLHMPAHHVMFDE